MMDTSVMVTSSHVQRSRRSRQRRYRSGGFDARDPPRQRATDGIRMILLQVVQSGSERHHAAMLQRRSELACESRRDDGPGVAGEQQFWIWRGLERGVRGFEHDVNVMGLTRDRELARQRKNRLSAVRGGEWRTVGGHFIVTEFVHDRDRKALDEGVGLEHQLLADIRRAEFPE